MRGEETSVSEFKRIVVRLVPEIPKLVKTYTIFSILYEGFKLVPPYLIKLIIDNIFLAPNVPYLIALVVGMFVSLLLLTVIEAHALSYTGNAAAQFGRAMEQRVFAKLMELPMSWHEKHNSGTIISKVTKASGYIRDLIWYLTNDIVPITVQLVLTAGFLLWVEWRLGLIFIFFVPIILWLIDRQVKAVSGVRTYYHQQHEFSVRELAQSLYNVQTVKDYVQEEREKKTHSHFLLNFCKGVARRTLLEAKAIISRDATTTFMRTVTLGLAVYLVIRQIITPGDLVLVFTLTEKAFSHIYRLGKIYYFMGDTKEALERALSIQTAQNPLPDQGQATFRNGDIAFDKVTFRYGRQAVLAGISLRVPEKKITALVGPSGSGKTTFVKLITRHYDPQQGSVTIGGIDIREIPLHDLRSHIAFVSQHTEIFDRTVHENIAYARPTATRREVIAAAKAAHAHDFISQFPDGYDTLVGERGIRLSGGQRQRISIARAILARTDIIIFDEATSSLDSESESLIQKAVLSIKDKTLIIIAHRLSTIQHADNIVVLKAGKVHETGSHTDLMKDKKGIYRRMRVLQGMGELRE